MTIKAYRNAAYTGSVFELVPEEGTTFYAVRHWDVNVYLTDIPVAPGTTSIKFFVDSTFPGEIWSDATVERGHWLYFFANNLNPSLGPLHVPMEGGQGEDLPPAPAVVTHATPKGYICVRDFGATGQKTGDDTVALKAAAAACAATASDWGSTGLYFPPGGVDSGVYVATETVDFRGISTVKAEGAYLVSWGSGRTEPKFKFGVPYNTGAGRYVFGGFYDLSENYKQRQPLVQFSGLHAAHVEIGSCPNFVEFYAGGSDTDQTYVGMFFSRVFLGRTFRVELRSEAAESADWVNFDQTKGWINTNHFQGGQICHLRIGGPWRDVVSLQADGDHTIVETVVPHWFFTGNLVEMTTNDPVSGQHGLVVRLDATHFRIPGSYADASLGWRAMGPGGYSHNDNHFYGSDTEDSPAMTIINNAHCTHIHGNRMEAVGELVFGPDAYLNTVEVSNTTHGRLPVDGEVGDLTLVDYSNGKNFYGWIRLPKPWGA